MKKKMTHKVFIELETNADGITDIKDDCHDYEQGDRATKVIGKIMRSHFFGNHGEIKVRIERISNNEA